MEKSIKVHYEARLNRNISIGGTKYKKGTVVFMCPDRTFEKLTTENIHKITSFSICEGYGRYEYFDLKKDIEFFKVEIIITQKEIPIKLKK